MQDFRNLVVWNKAHRLTLDIYKKTRGFPREELFGLTAQLRRASASIGANIAEGCGRGSDKDFARFLQTAMGSACEVEYHLLLARDVGLIDELEHSKTAESVEEVKRMLAAFIEKLRVESF